MRTFSVTATVAALLALGLAACGGSGSNGSTSSAASGATSSGPATSSSAASSTSAAPASAGATTLTNAADPSGQLTFEKSSLIAKAGKITIDFTNASSVPHNLTIVTDLATLAVLGATPTFSGGGTKSVTVTLKPGSYTFICTVPGHDSQGMQGTLTVT